MKIKLDLSKFKKVSQDDKIAVLEHPDGHRFHVAVNALHPMNRKNLDTLAMADGGEVGNPKLEESKKSPRKDKLEIEAIKSEKSVKPEGVDYEPYGKLKAEPMRKRMAEGGEAIDYDKLIPQEQADNAPYGSGAAMQGMQGMAPQRSLAMDSSQAPTPDGASVPINVPGVTETPPPAPEAGIPPKSPSPGENTPPKSPEPVQQSGMDKQVAGINAQASAQAALGNQQAAIMKAQASAANELMTKYQSHFDELDTERKALQQDIQQGHIDPNRYLGSMDTGARVATAIGLVLGGIGGGGRGNQALDLLNNQIDRDIQVQKSDLGKKESLLSANLKQFGNLHDAMSMTRVMMNDTTVAKLQQAVAKAQDPMAKAHAQQAIGALEAQMQPVMQQLALKQMLAAPSSGGLIKADPAHFVSSLVPSDKQKEVFGQIEAAQNTRHMGSSIMKSFDDAANDNTIAKTGAGLLRTPASVYALHQSMQPTFKDLEGTVRQAAMENTFKNITPAPGDASSTIATKRKALEEYLQSKASAPMAKGYGIDLEKFESTAAMPESRLSPQQKSYADWAKANPQDPRSAQVLKKLGIQ